MDVDAEEVDGKWRVLNGAPDRSRVLFVFRRRENTRRARNRRDKPAGSVSESCRRVQFGWACWYISVGGATLR
jgi:hypothetical protein